MMAKFNIPGLELVSTGRPVINRFDHSKCDMEIEFRVTSWSKLIWHVLRTHYDILWWQWPYALFLYCKIVMELNRNGLRRQEPAWSAEGR